MAVDNASDVEMSDELQESQALLTNEDFEIRLSRPDKRLQKHVSDIFGCDNEKDYHDHVNRFCEFCCKNELYHLRARRLLCDWRRNNYQSAFGFALSQLEFQLDNHAKNNSTRIPDLSTWAVGISPSSLIRTASIQLHRSDFITVADLSKIYDLCQESEMRENGEDEHGNGNRNGDGDIDKDKYREEEKEKSADVEQTQINIDFLQQSLMIEYLYNAYALCQSKINVNNGHDNGIILSNAIKKQRNELINDLTNISTQICHDKNYDVSLSNHIHKQNLLFESIIIWIRYCVIEKDGYFNTCWQVLFKNILFWYDLFLTSFYITHIYMYVGLIYKRCNVAELMDEMISIPKGLKALTEMEILQKLLDMLIFILQYGEYKIILDIMSSKHIAKLDLTLLCHFIQRIIYIISPHVPSDFINCLFDIFKHENTMNAIKNDNFIKNDLLDFVENVRSKK
ncbi:hypothetical protein RFI_40364 [Reticulomyxa filosa]|uniref:Uncharacterized protein n=1 Tax=Reticulomyxa filosa TaxID=46433 RepID=X6L6Y1_RETFI|nr:hypothetical protein RFI_40364 [Reticulomyxa filosa]|eukprot:ETN97167.1 hypothetical protein RFI_40364 [Reticulomyxa filosa]